MKKCFLLRGERRKLILFPFRGRVARLLLKVGFERSEGVGERKINRLRNPYVAPGAKRTPDA